MAVFVSVLYTQTTEDWAVEVARGPSFDPIHKHVTEAIGDGDVRVEFEGLRPITESLEWRAEVSTEDQSVQLGGKPMNQSDLEWLGLDFSESCDLGAEDRDAGGRERE